MNDTTKYVEIYYHLPHIYNYLFINNSKALSLEIFLKY